MEMNNRRYLVFTPKESNVGADLSCYQGSVGKVLLEPDGYSLMYHLEFPDGKRIAAWPDEVRDV